MQHFPRLIPVRTLNLKIIYLALGKCFLACSVKTEKTRFRIGIYIQQAVCVNERNCQLQMTAENTFVLMICTYLKVTSPFSYLKNQT